MHADTRADIAVQVVLFGGFSASSALPLLGRLPELSLDKVRSSQLATTVECRPLSSR